jgi:YspA, cpYpsA-related SLOG family
VRALFTVSRDWEDEAIIARDLTTLVGKHVKGETLIVMHGDCSNGDRMVRNWCESLAGHFDNMGVVIQEERYPAEWHRHGKRAGFMRNAAMVARKPDICFAYINVCRGFKCRRPELHGSHGATHCSGLAKSAGIRTIYRRRGYVVPR